MADSRRVLDWYAARARPALARAGRRRRGRCWSARSCCSRRRWPGCCPRTRPGWRAGPTPAALAADSPGEAVRMWGKLGYPRRALRLHACAAAIGEPIRRRGARPRSRTSRRCPASAPTPRGRWRRSRSASAQPVVDTNVRRVVARAVVGGQGEAGPPSPARDHAAVAALLPRRRRGPRGSASR